jgi:hypothetical protein
MRRARFYTEPNKKSSRTLSTTKTILSLFGFERFYTYIYIYLIISILWLVETARCRRDYINTPDDNTEFDSTNFLFTLWEPMLPLANL